MRRYISFPAQTRPESFEKFSESFSRYRMKALKPTEVNENLFSDINEFWIKSQTLSCWPHLQYHPQGCQLGLIEMVAFAMWTLIPWTLDWDQFILQACYHRSSQILFQLFSTELTWVNSYFLPLLEPLNLYKAFILKTNIYFPLSQVLIWPPLMW